MGGCQPGELSTLLQAVGKPVISKKWAEHSKRPALSQPHPEYRD